MASVCSLFQAGRSEEAEDLFDIYLPLVRHEQQPGFGLAVRKEILRRRGAIRSAAVRAPGPKLDPDDVAELDRLLARLERHLDGHYADLLLVSVAGQRAQHFRGDFQDDQYAR